MEDIKFTDVISKNVTSGWSITEVKFYALC
jgi:hypothetical protein